jgi:hypothetical protein
MKTIRDLQEKHQKELEEFTAQCPHKSVLIEQGSNYHYGYSIVLRCVVCRTPIMSWSGAEKPDYSQPDKGQIDFAYGFKRIEK